MRQLVIAITAALTVLTSGLLSQDRRQGWSTSLATNAMDLVEVQPSSIFKLTTVFVLKNVSGKPITAFAVTHEAVTHTIDYFPDGGLQPQATYPLSIGNQELSGSDPILKIAAVVFEDGTEQGLQEQADFIRGRRLGRLFETWIRGQATQGSMR
jgi:hypothetical protein